MQQGFNLSYNVNIHFNTCWIKDVFIDTVWKKLFIILINAYFDP